MGSHQLFCLRWSNHQMNMLSVFDQLLQSEALVDVTLACEGLSFRAHKVVLSACSPYFQSLFMENPCKHPIVILKDIKYSDLRALVDFMYKGEVNVTQEQLSALLKTAETLKVKGLAEMTSSNNNNMNEGSSSMSSASVTRESTAAAAAAAANDHSAASIAGPPPSSSSSSSNVGLHPALHHRTGSPLPKRKKTRHQAQASHHVLAYRPPSSREASLDGDDSLDIQGSPEVIETKVEMPSDGFMPEESADQDSQMVDEHANENDSHVKTEFQEEKKPLTFQNTTTSASGTSLNKNNMSNSNNNNANPCSEPTTPPLPCSLPAAPPPTTTSSSSMPPSLPSTSGTQPSTSQGLKPLDFVLNDPYWLDRPPAKLAITLARKCIFGDEVLKQSNLTARNNMKPLDHEKMELIKTQSRNAPDAPDSDDSMDMSPLHQNNTSSVIEAIGSQLFGRYAPLTILPINQSIGSSSLRLEPSSPSSNNSSSSNNPKRGQPRILNEEEENLIVHYILDMAARGKPVTRKCVLEYGNMLLRRQDRVPTGSIHCNPEKGLSNDWWKEFKKRHPGLPFRLPVTPNS
uniref:BTB domain-containing protein n=1 Tax=Strigamia maritima TaxID=126957 RepID=T1JEJ6_STRMM